MHVLYLASEVAPFSSTGELGEFSGNLPRALKELGVEVTVISPNYQEITPERFGLARRISKIDVPLGGQTTQIELLDGKFVNCDVPIILVDHPPSFGRAGYYGDADGPFTDNFQRFHLLCRAALRIIQERDLKIDLIHANNWQAGLLPLLLKFGAAPDLQHIKTLFTIHDITQGGLFPREAMDSLQLQEDLFHPEGVEFHGQVSLLKAGTLYADRLTTLSPCYAREIQTEELGGGLHGLMTTLKEKLEGVVGGIDQSIWNPQSDHRLEERYSAESFDGKEACKRALQSQLGLQPRPQVPLLTVFGPLTEDSGASVLLESIPQMMSLPLQLAIFGPADPDVEQAIREHAAANPDALVYHPTISADNTHRALAGADCLILPPRAQPGGLLQLKALRYGTIPIARSVGDLRDTVIDFDPGTATGTGFCWQRFEADALLSAVGRMQAVFKEPPRWRALQENGMRQDFSWSHTATKYEQLYRTLLT